MESLGGGRYSGHIVDGWDIGGNANGGYLLALAARAMVAEVGRPPLSLTAHYLRPGKAGPVTAEVHVVRSGRRLATARADLVGEAGAVISLLGTFGEQQPGGVQQMMQGPPDLPAYDRGAAKNAAGSEFQPSLMGRLAMQLRPEDTGFARGEPSGRAVIGGWFDFADHTGHEEIDVFGVLLAADAFPPVVFNSGLPTAWVPTVEFTVHVRGVPAAGPLRCEFRSRFIGDGLLDEEGELWDVNDVLVAQSRQLALVPRN